MTPVGESLLQVSNSRTPSSVTLQSSSLQLTPPSSQAVSTPLNPYKLPSPRPTPSGLKRKAPFESPSAVGRAVNFHERLLALANSLAATHGGYESTAKWTISNSYDNSELERDPQQAIQSIIEQDCHEPGASCQSRGRAGSCHAQEEGHSGKHRRKKQTQGP